MDERENAKLKWYKWLLLPPTIVIRLPIRIARFARKHWKGLTSAAVLLAGIAVYVFFSLRHITLPENTRATRAKVNIIIIVVDGGRPDVYEKTRAKNILSLKKLGSYTMNAQTVTPPWTAPAHISLGTGISPDKHGIKTNSIDILKNFHQVQKILSGEIPTLLHFAKAAGFKTITVTEHDVTTKARVSRIFIKDLVDKLELVSGGSEEVLAKAALYLEDEDYIFMPIHLPELDQTGHRFGWMSPEQFQAVKVIDKAFGKFLNVWKHSPKWKNTYLFFTSDHGGHDRIHSDNIPEDMTIPWFIVGPKVKRGYKISNVKDGGKVRPLIIYDTAATVLDILGFDIPANWDGKPVRDAFRKGYFERRSPRRH